MLEQMEMVPGASLAAMALVALFTLAFPLALGLIFWRRAKGRWRFFFLGCVVFPLFALGLEGAINRAVLYGPAGAVLAGNIWLYGLFGGLMAGISEECGRWCALRLGRRWSRGPQDALMYGAGHGGIEAVLLAGTAMVSNLMLSLAWNSGGPAGAAALMGVDSLTDAQAAALASLAATPAGMFLWSGFERLGAIVLHISLSVLVYAAVHRKGGWYWLPAAIGIHALVDMAAVVTSACLPIPAVEGIFAVLVLGTVLLARWLYFLEKARNPLTFHREEGV